MFLGLATENDHFWLSHRLDILEAQLKVMLERQDYLWVQFKRKAVEDAKNHP